MKQVLTYLKDGTVELVETSGPAVRAGALRIATRTSLISIGTERMLLSFGRASWIDKVRQQPAKVQQVLAKIKSDGLWPTLDAVKAKLVEPISLGYCNAGVVIEVGAGVEGWRVGDRVLSNGPHAEVVTVPVNLCAKIPENVGDAQAPFAVAGAIGLQGIRLLQPTMGECFVVTGLGLIGLLAVQLLRAHGARVLGVDVDHARCELARQFGVEVVELALGQDPLAAARALSRNAGVDGVLITASSTGNELVSQAAQMCRKRGRIVLVGVTGLELNRAEFYEKELTFQVSCSYGPGRYDTDYEEKGRDYPLPFVRWTEQRNFQAVLEQMALGHLVVDSLITARHPFDQAIAAYEDVSKKDSLGILLEYAPLAESALARPVAPLRVAPRAAGAAGLPVLGFLGAGNYTMRSLLPALDACGQEVRRKVIVSGTGVSGALAARRFKIEQSSTDSGSVLTDPEINTVIITTRHNSHAKLVLAALAAGQRVFVEKPLCLTLGELEEIKQAVAGQPAALMVGFNRRFSPHVRKIMELLGGARAPLAMIYTVNAGLLPANHWTLDRAVGGGRIIGEACHFVDLLRFLANAPITSHHATFLGRKEGEQGDVTTLNLAFGDGSIGSVHYLANGDPLFPKERLEIFCGGRVLQLDNYRVLTGYGCKGFKQFKTSSQDKGHAAELAAFLTAVRAGAPMPIPLEQILEVSEVAIKLAESYAGQC